MTDDPQMIWEHGEPTGHTSWGPDRDTYHPMSDEERGGFIASTHIAELEARVAELEAELLDLNTASWQRVAHHHCDARINALQARVADAPSVSQYTQLERERDETRKQRDAYRTRAEKAEAEAEKLERGKLAWRDRAVAGEAEVEKLQEEGKL